MDSLEKIISLVWSVIVFALVSIIFLPALLIVNLFQSMWSKKLGDLFKY